MLEHGARLLVDGKWEDALACFESSGGPKAIFGQAVALQLLGRFEDAANAYDRVLEMDPRHQEALANLVAMCVELFDLERVERYAARLLALDEDSAIALQGLIVVAVERRDYESAGLWFARLRPCEDGRSDAVEYRLSRDVVERLRDLNGPVAHPY